MMTHKQRALLVFIKDYQSRNDGVSPSFDEMTDALGLRSKSGIHRLITGLVERGKLRRLTHKVRALEVTDGVRVEPAYSQEHYADALRVVGELDSKRRLASSPETAVDEVAIIAEALWQAEVKALTMGRA